jgi:glucokinase
LNFIVDSIAKFTKDRNIRKQLPIGFTFPFPMKHESLTCGKLVRWIRDFKGTGAEDKDIVQLLKEASREGVSIQRTTATSLGIDPYSML